MGADRFAFLQGLITQDIELLRTAPMIYAAMLTPQGRFSEDLFIKAESDDSFLLDIYADSRETLLKKLKIYKLRNQVTLEAVDDLHVIQHPAGSGDTIKDPRGDFAGARQYVGTLPADLSDDYDAWRIPLGLPEGHQDLLPDKTIILEANFEELNAVSFTKGCYMGQELVSRTKYVGQIRKRLVPLTFEGPAPEVGAEITALKDGVEKKAGTVTSATDGHALALLRLEYAESDLVCSDTTLMPAIPEWLKQSL